MVGVYEVEQFHLMMQIYREEQIKRLREQFNKSIEKTTADKSEDLKT